MRTQFVTSAEGVKIAYDIQGSGPGLCLLHGFSNDRTIWSEYGWIIRLQSQFTVFTIDIRGCGESDAPTDSQAYSAQAHRADIVAVADACGIETFLLWGWSFGATLGLEFAACSPRVTKAVIAGTYFGRIFTDEYVQRRLSQTHSIVERARWQGLGSWPGVEPHELHCTTLAYTGTEDGNVVVQLKRQRTAIEQAGLRLHIFEGFGHGHLLSRQDAVAAVVLSFLNESPDGQEKQKQP